MLQSISGLHGQLPTNSPIFTKTFMSLGALTSTVAERPLVKVTWKYAA
jgi:hypothetical protein